jgi:ABC-type uncharacterized transport system substrate-binding protein
MRYGRNGLELLRELLPNAKVIAVLVNPTKANAHSDRQNEKTAASPSRCSNEPFAMQ